jgi:hypothetical protein
LEEAFHCVGRENAGEHVEGWDGCEYRVAVDTIIVDALVVPRWGRGSCLLTFKNKWINSMTKHGRETKC